MSDKKKRILYYSINFNNEVILKLVEKYLFDLPSNDTNTNIYIKLNEKSDIDSFNTLYTKIEKNTKNIIYTTFENIINKLKINDLFIINNNQLYLINKSFHITTLFTGGKQHVNSAEMDNQLDKKVIVKLNKFAISHDFITFGVEFIHYEDEMDASYYGNHIMHITIGLNIMGEKVFPKNSYIALSDGETIEISDIIEGITSIN